MQIGLVKYFHFSYQFASFEGCIRSIIQNGYLYDLQNPTEEYLSGVGCRNFCNPCSNGGYCYGIDGESGGCRCPFGYMGKSCAESK